MTYESDNPFEFINFEPESFLVPPTDGFIRRLLGARWGLFLVSAPDNTLLSPVLDFLANYSLQMAYYSEFSTEIGEFEHLEREERKIHTLDEIIDEAKHAVVDEQENNGSENGDLVRHIPRNPECVFLPEIENVKVNDAIEAALSGRLVVSGIKAQGSFSALQTFRHLVGSDHLAAASLMGILGLNTVARICPHCRIRVEREVSSESYELLGIEEKSIISYRGAGCKECEYTGYEGKILIHEGFELSEKIRSYLLESVSPRSLRMTAKREGMNTLLDSAWDLVDQGETTLEEVIRIAEVTDPGKNDD
ncbi:MAG TPA: hypothetical protein VGB30_07160 [bacterium]|jgi:type II secretory ATPase GspE/PulE/Tfp pilus assembly ATPase PilB-like protein